MVASSGPGPNQDPQPKIVSDETRRDAGLSDPELWLRYFELGGMRTLAEMESYLRQGVVSAAHDQDVLAQVLDERFSELGRNESPVRGGATIGLPGDGLRP